VVQTATDAFDPHDCDQLFDPSPAYARARAHHPVFFHPRLQAWYVTRYDDIMAVLRDPAYVCGDPAAEPFDSPAETAPTGGGRLQSLAPLERISDAGTRRAVAHAIKQIAANGADARVRAIAGTLVAGFRHGGGVDLVRDYTVPLATRVILDIVGADDDAAALTRWAEDWKAVAGGQLTPADETAALARLRLWQQRWRGWLDERSSRPRNDVLSALAAACDAGSWDGRARIVNACIVVALSGYETTAYLLGWCLYRLLVVPERWQSACADKETIPLFVEETLRADSPVQTLMRTTVAPVELSGVRIPAGARVALCFASANHDEACFHDADRFDPARDGLGRHLAFGFGLHHCLGAPLARLEARVAVEVLTEEVPGMSLVPGGELSVVPSWTYRALQALRVQWCA
jgi:cytochrome P450